MLLWLKSNLKNQLHCKQQLCMDCSRAGLLVFQINVKEVDNGFVCCSMSEPIHWSTHLSNVHSEQQCWHFLINCLMAQTSNLGQASFFFFWQDLYHTSGDGLSCSSGSLMINTILGAKSLGNLVSFSSCKVICAPLPWHVKMPIFWQFCFFWFVLWPIESNSAQR